MPSQLKPPTFIDICWRKGCGHPVELHKHYRYFRCTNCKCKIPPLIQRIMLWLERGERFENQW